MVQHWQVNFDSFLSTIFVQHFTFVDMIDGYSRYLFIERKLELPVSHLILTDVFLLIIRQAVSLLSYPFVIRGIKINISNDVGIRFIGNDLHDNFLVIIRMNLHINSVLHR